MHGHQEMAPCSCRPLQLGKDGRGPLEGRSETWLASRHVQGCKNPEIAAIEKRRNPGKRKRIEECGNGTADFRHTRHHKCQQGGEQQERDHPADTCEQKRLIVREAQYEQAEARSIRCLYVSLRPRHTHSLRVIVLPGTQSFAHPGPATTGLCRWGGRAKGMKSPKLEPST